MEPIHGANALTEDLLRKLAGAEGPCLTIVLPTNARSDLKDQLKDAIRMVGHPELTASLMDDADFVPPSSRPTGSLVILRSSEIFVRFFTRTILKGIAYAGDLFQIQSLLPALDEDKEFYLLALSQKRVRLMLCTAETQTEVPLAVGMDNEHEDLLTYLHAVNKAVNTVLHGLSVPLLPVAVEHELALYRKANTYPNLVEPGVHGSPDSMKGAEIHERALASMRSYLAPPIRKILEEFDKLTGTGHASSDEREIENAAREGRVSHLFLGDNAELNGAVVETLRHGGQVSALAAEQMPNGATAAAVFRYAAGATGH